MKRLRITDSNVLDCEETLRFLRDDLDKLVEMLKDYPVIIEFCGIREVFRSREDILAAIGVLNDRIVAYRNAA